MYEMYYYCSVFYPMFNVVKCTVSIGRSFLFFNQLIVLVKIIIIIWEGFLSIRKPVRF